MGVRPAAPDPLWEGGRDKSRKDRTKVAHPPALKQPYFGAALGICFPEPAPKDIVF